MRQAQATLEYVCLAAIVAAAIIAILVYASRGFQGNLRTQADQMGEQYSPKNMNTKIVETSTVAYVDIVDDKVTTSKTTTEMTNRGFEKINSLSQERY